MPVAPAPAPVSFFASSASTESGLDPPRFTRPSSLAVESPESADPPGCSAPPAPAPARRPPGPPFATRAPSSDARRSARRVSRAATRIIRRTACCHSVRIDCFTRGKRTTSTTPRRIASIMYALFPTSSSSCMSTIAHSDVSFANRAPIAAEDEPLAFCGSFEPAVVCAAKNKGSACFSSTSATSNGAAGEAVSSARMPFSRVVAVVTDVSFVG